MKKIIALALACSMTFGLVACGGGSSSKETTAKGGESTASADSLAVCLASEPDTIDPALNSAVDGGTMATHLFSGLAKWAQDESGKLVIALMLLRNSLKE